MQNSCDYGRYCGHFQYHADSKFGPLTDRYVEDHSGSLTRPLTPRAISSK